MVGRCSLYIIGCRVIFIFIVLAPVEDGHFIFCEVFNGCYVSAWINTYFYPAMQWLVKDRRFPLWQSAASNCQINYASNHTSDDSDCFWICLIWTVNHYGGICVCWWGRRVWRALKLSAFAFPAASPTRSLSPHKSLNTADIRLWSIVMIYSYVYSLMVVLW